jgi:alpha-1,6-mannosyltransferase
VVKGGLALLGVVLGSALILVLTADRPSFLAATTVQHYFPGWMAGPLGGLWPSLTRSTLALKWIVSGTVVAMYAGYVLSLRYAPRLPARYAVAAVVAVHAIALLSPPFALTDVFNYVNYARMEVVHHLNPYTTIPVLEPHSDPSFALSNWHELLSPYGPLFTLMTFAVVPLGVAGAFWALKALLMAASLATLALVWRCARLLGRDPVAAIVLVGLNPIVLVWGLAGDHNDAFMMLLVVLGFHLLLRRRPTLGGGAFAAAVAIKASAGILIPVVLAGTWREQRALTRTLLGMLIAAAVLAGASVIAFGLHIPDLSTQGRLVTSVSVPNLLGLALGQGGETDTLRRLLELVLVSGVAASCVLAWRRRESLTAAGWASVALLVTLSWVLPWYVLWVLPLAALSSSRRLRKTTLLLGVYLIAAWAPITGTVFDAIGFHPEKTALGRLHQRYVKDLLY